MPRKQPRNSFYFYMLDFKEEQRQKGINYSNMAEVAEAAGEVWKQAPPSVRSKYEKMAKSEKDKKNTPNMKYTSTGVPLSVIKKQEDALREAERAERDNITKFVNEKLINQDILSEDIFLMDLNSYCVVDGVYYIGEISVLRFNLQEGIKDQYHEMVNPGDIPTGYASNAKIACQELGLEMPYGASDDLNYKERILAHIIAYMTKEGTLPNLPPIFTMPEKVEPVSNFIYQMCERAGEFKKKFYIYKLDLLFYTMVQSLKITSDEGFPKESLALTLLKKDPFKYTPELGCQQHETADMSIECTTSRTKRWAFTMMDTLCPLAGIPLEPGRHLPYDFDLNTIRECRDMRKLDNAQMRTQKKQAENPGEAGPSGLSLNRLEIKDDAEEKPKRVHEPLRMPKNDVIASQQAALPVMRVPDDEGFVLYSDSYRTRGRGRKPTQK